MIRRRFRKPAVTLSLFPFLAVLVCTMGALIVLLVTVLQKARVDAADVAASQEQATQQAQASLEELRLEQEDQEWRRSELEKQRSEYQQQLARQRLTLSHFEEHIRQLEEQLKQLASQADGLRQLAKQAPLSADSQAQQLALQGEIERLRARLARAQEEAKGRKPAFAIIPYEGPNGTKRRPIYIECTDQGVILQPEGIVLSPSDFSGSLGTGNPLDAALRTTREYLAKYDATMTQGEPYPLLVVRPNGTIAYAAARSALKSWDDEFGYELVEDDLTLAYPKRDPALAAELERTIQDARQRQEILASVMPGKYKSSSAGAGGLVASSSGGFTQLGGPAGGTGASGGAAGTTAGMPGSGGNALPPGGAATSFTHTFRSAGLGPDEKLTSMQSVHQGGGGSARSGSTNRFAAAGTGTGSGTGTGTGSEMNSAGGTGSGSTASPSAGNSQGGTSSSNSPWGQPGMPGQAGTSPFSGGGTPSSESADASATEGQPAKKGSPRSRGSSNAQPLAHTRGADWGLPQRSSTATGIQRYVQLECHPDHLVLPQDRAGYRNPTVIPLGDDVAASVDPLISTLWKRMEQWGLAADGCYWKPVLRVQVLPGAEERFAELSTLLESSGVVLERKN